MRFKAFNYHSNLKRSIWSTVLLCLPLITMEVMWGLYIAHSVLQLFLSLIWVLVFARTLNNFLEIFRLWPSKKYLAVIPVVISLAVIVFADDVNWFSRQMHFRYFQNDFERIIEMIRTSEIDLKEPRPDARIWIPDGLIPGCLFMHAFRRESDDLAVLFFIGNGFPCKHSGVLYLEGSPLGPGIRTRAIARSRDHPGNYYSWHD